MDTVILPGMTYGAEAWALTKHQEKKLAEAQRSMERSLLKHHEDKIRNEVIRSENRGERYNRGVQWVRVTVGRTCSQNEQHQVGQDNIRMDTQRRKTSKRKTEKEMERQHGGSW